MSGERLPRAVKCQWPEPEPHGCMKQTKSLTMMCHLHLGMTPPARHSKTVDQTADAKLSEVKLSSGRSAVEHDNERLYLPYKKSREEQDILSNAILDAYEDPDQDRCQIQAACGMGKTIIHQQVIDGISERLLEKEGRAGTFVVMSPRKNLTKQLRGEYIEDGFANITDENGDPIDGTAFSVHDDSPDLKPVSSTNPVKRTEEERANLDQLKEFLSEENESGRPRIVYIVDSPESIGKVAQIQGELNHQFDGAIFDEAHNLTGVKGEPDGRGKAPQFSRVFLNEDPNGIKSDFRVFTTATIKDASSQSNDLFRDTMVGPPRDARSDYLSIAATMDSGGSVPRGVPLYQSDETMFGKVAGPRYGLQYAVNQDLLVKPDFQVREIEIRGGDNVRVTRDTPVSFSGNVKSKPDGEAVSLGTYQNIQMALSSLADDPDPEYLAANDGPQRRNHLAFVNSVSEAKAMADPDKWSGVADAMAAQQLGGRKLSPSEADGILSDPDRFSAAETRAARLVLLGRHAGVMPLDSTMSQSQQDTAMNWLDRRKPWDSDGGQQGKDYHGWTPHAKVLGNFDMVSEGINLPMVDTVAMNRPRKHQDEDIYQAVARACRKAVDRNSDGEVVRDYKPRARIIVGDTIQTTGRGQRRPERTTTAATMRSISRVWRANAEVESDSTYSGDDAVTTRYTSSGQRHQDYHGGMFSEADTVLGVDEVDPRAAALVAYSRREIETRAKAAYRKAKPSRKWEELQLHEQEARINEFAGKTASDSSKSGQVATAYLSGVKAMGDDGAEVSQAYLRDLRDRQRRSDWMDPDKGEVEAVQQYYDISESGRYRVPKAKMEDLRKSSLRSMISAITGRGGR